MADEIGKSLRILQRKYWYWRGELNCFERNSEVTKRGKYDRLFKIDNIRKENH